MHRQGTRQKHRLFYKQRKLTNCQLADRNRQINCNHQGAKAQFPKRFRYCINWNICDISKLKNT